MNPKDLRIQDFTYVLPHDRIPVRPATQRELARLLVYRHGVIEDSRFSAIGEYLESRDQLFINDTRVIPARLHFTRQTGARIEIFCLEPEGLGYDSAMTANTSVVWNCLVGNAKKWKEDLLITEFDQPSTGRKVLLRAERLEALGEGRFRIRFSWKPLDLSFSEIISHAGSLPLPPYFQRDPEEEDYIRYQTVFAERPGSVAAPTAGLHFTPDLLSNIRSKGVDIRHLTLHVGAGTFRPVSSDRLADHDMHGEWFSVSRDVIRSLASPARGRRISVGTTSTRTLESLYWMGVKCLAGLDDWNRLGQWEPYELSGKPSLEESINALLTRMAEENLPVVSGVTSIIITPGYSFRVCEGLVTNFHMPESTLILLVAAFVGDDWKRIYEHALSGDYRFLSYGDSSLLLP